jgi:hypothetical protein
MVEDFNITYCGEIAVNLTSPDNGENNNILLGVAAQA